MENQVQAIIFDFDGTIVNTLDDLANAVNYTLRAFDLPEHPVEAYKHLVGNGVETLIKRASGNDSRAEEICSSYKEYYNQHMTDVSRPYAGIVELLNALSAKGVKMAVLSNKPDDATKALVKQFFPEITFACVTGASEHVPVKPDPTGVRVTLENLSVSPQNCVFAGDSNVDMQTAKNAGCTACGVLWGFRDGQELLEAGADYLCAQPSDILDLFSSLK